MSIPGLIQISLFSVEFLLSIIIVASFCNILKIQPFTSSMPCTAMIHTIFALWPVHVVLKAIQIFRRPSLKNLQYKDDENDPIMTFQSRFENNREQFCNCRTCTIDLSNNNDDVSDNQPFEGRKVPTVLTDSMKFVENCSIESSDQDSSKFSLYIWPVLVTLALHYSICVFVLVHNLQRVIRRTLGLDLDSHGISFFDVPLTIGKTQSLSRASFFVCSFLNKCANLRERFSHRSNHGSDYSFANIVEAITLDQLALRSSQIFLGPSHLQECSVSPDKMVSSWLGLCLEDVVLTLTIFFNEKHKLSSKQTSIVKDLKNSSETLTKSTSMTCIKSITLVIQVESIKFDLFPFLKKRIVVQGITFQGNATFQDNSRPVLSYKSPCVMSNTMDLFGFGMSITCNHLIVDRFFFKDFSVRRRHNKILSWDNIHFTTYLQQLVPVSPNTQRNLFREIMVSSMTLPIGNVHICSAGDEQYTTAQVSKSSLKRKVALSLGSNVTIYKSDGNLCPNRCVVAINLEVMHILLLIMESLFQDVSNSFPCDNIQSNDDDSPPSKKNEPKRSSPLEFVQLNAACCVCVYSAFARSNLKERDTVGALYLTSSHVLVDWKKFKQVDLHGSDISHHQASRIEKCGVEDLSLSYPSTLVVDVREISLQYYDKFLTDVVLLKSFKTKMLQLPSENNPLQSARVDGVEGEMGCLNTDLGCLLVRVDDTLVRQLASFSKAVKSAVASAMSLQCRAKKIKRTLTNGKIHVFTTSGEVIKRSQPRRMVDRINLSCISIDAVFELQPPLSKSCGKSLFKDGSVRVSLLHKKAGFNVIFGCKACDLIQNCDVLPIRNALFEPDSGDSCNWCITEAEIFQIESSVTFYPHSSLPVIKNEYSLPTTSLETSFYGRANSVIVTFSTTSSISSTKAKLHAITFNELHVYEFTNQKNEKSLFSIPVRDFSPCSDVRSGDDDWPIERAYKDIYKTSGPIKILSANGKLWRLEKRNIELGEITQIVNVQFRKSSTATRFAWSPIFHWLQESCNQRMQLAFSYFMSLIAGVSPNQVYYSCQKTSIYLQFETNMMANLFMFLGVETVMQIIIENGFKANLAMAKYLTHDSTKNKILKPNIVLESARLVVMLNDITTPIFVFNGLSLENFTRHALHDEVSQYVKKKSSRRDVFDDIVTDHEGNPLKEIFDVKFGSCRAKFLPTLHLGQVMDDMLLTPRSVDIGLDSLRNIRSKREKIYQIMSITCKFRFVDISLLENDPCWKNNSTATLMSSDRMNLYDVARVYFESINLSIERNTPPEWTQSQLSLLDEDKSNVYTYGPSIQGGMIHLNIDHVVATLTPLNLITPLICCKHLKAVGLLYMTGLSPTTPGVTAGRTIDSLILCHHDSGLGNGSSERGRCYCRYGVSLQSNGIPVKVYADCELSCRVFKATYGSVMNPSIPILMACVKRLLPPPSKLQSNQEHPTLTAWWDITRFFLHGKCSVFSNELSVQWLLDSHLLCDHSIILTCQNWSIHYDLGSFIIDAADLNVSIPGTAYDMSLHPSKRQARKTPHFPHEADCSVGKGRHPFIYLPKIKTEIKFKWKMLQPKTASCAHHSPYLNHFMQCQSSCNDKFDVFRSDGTSINFDFSLAGDDLIGNWLVLRIDVLPWLTHLNPTVASSTNPGNDKSEVFPPCRNVAINGKVNRFKLATWFSGKEVVHCYDMEGPQGLCLFVKQIKYASSATGDTELTIEGPLKAALLDVSKFDDNVEDQSQTNHGMIEIETMARVFGGAENERVDLDHLTPLSDKDSKSFPFMKLHDISSNIKELDYVVIAGQIDIQNKSLEKILAKSHHTHHCHENATSDGTCKDQRFVHEKTWSILVSRLKLLWTLDIRDNLMAISQDLLFTIGYMNSQIRQSHVLTKKSTSPSQPFAQNTPSMAQIKLTEEGLEMTPSLMKTRFTGRESNLEYLLHRDSSFDLELTESSSNKVTYNHDPEQRGGIKENATIPTFDVHFSNPQIQLHSKSTGGSIILAMESAHIEGREFIRFITTCESGTRSISPSDLIRKTEQAYTLTNMEAYALNTLVDINAGLPWLEVCEPCDVLANEDINIVLKDKFGIDAHYDETTTTSNVSTPPSVVTKDSTISEDHAYIYPQNLRHHEPLSFLKTGILHPTLSKFTFKSRQLFHRPPIHYSTEELIFFIDEGLVVKQNEAAVDNVELKIDLLHFKLDSYQFKTTIDIIRSVLLEPPKPSRRHRSFGDEAAHSRKPSDKISSVAVTEMEEILAGGVKNRGRKGRDMLKSSAMSLLRDLEDRHALSGDTITRRISYRLKKLKWCIQSQDEIDDVEIAFTGFFGQHDYSPDGSVSSQFGLEDVRISSSKPGPDSICFTDPTSVLKSVIDERSPCQRCGKMFDHSQNDLNSCSFHTETFESGAWRCCRSTNIGALGCKTGPHTGKERAAIIRVETLPRIVEGITLYSHVEVNVFPGIPHTLIVQISKSLSRLFVSYFFIGDDDMADIDAESIITETTGSIDTLSTRADSTPKQTNRKTLLVGGKASPLTEQHQEGYDSSDLGGNAVKSEIVFIKVWRVGDINVEVSLGGFRRLPQTSFEICVPAYSKAYKIGSWAYLSQKFLLYLIHEVFKSGASSGLGKFRRMVVHNSVSSHVEDEKQESTSDPSPQVNQPANHNTFIGRHLRRPLGAQAILGNPTKSVKTKVKASFGKRS